MVLRGMSWLSFLGISARSIRFRLRTGLYRSSAVLGALAAESTSPRPRKKKPLDCPWLFCYYNYQVKLWSFFDAVGCLACFTLSCEGSSLTFFSHRPP